LISGVIVVFIAAQPDYTVAWRRRTSWGATRALPALSRDAAIVVSVWTAAPPRRVVR